MKLRVTPARMLGLSLLITGLSARPVPAQPPGEQLIDKVNAAYRAIQQYDATATLKMRQSDGRWTNSREGDFFLAFDRSANQLLMDMPDQLLVIDGKALYYKTPQIPNKHLVIPIDQDGLRIDWIIEQVPPLVMPMVQTDFAFLLADDPLAFISNDAAGEPVTLPPDEDDPQKRPRIQSAMQEGLMTLTINPETYLIDQVVVELDTAMMGAPAGMSMFYVLDVEVHSTGEPIDDDRFAFDTTGSKASPSMQHMMASGSNAAHPLTGQPTPALVLPDTAGAEYNIADEDAQVIVLDFWATWCPPCVAALPELQEVYDWAKTEGKPVAIYAVNQGETIEEVKQFWEDKGLTIPVLMDEEFVTAQPFMINGIPQTVIISNGKVQQVHVGYAPGIGERMKAEIEALIDSKAE